MNCLAERPYLVQYWDEGPPPADVAELVASMARRNPGLEHRIFDHTAAASFIGERFGARELAAFETCAVPAMQADYFRYCAVLALGGIYADVDFRCVSALAPLLPQTGGALFGRAGIPSGWPQDLFGDRPRVGPFRIVANSIFLFAEPGHPLLRVAVKLATANVESRIADDVAVVTGPGIFTSLYLAGQLGSLDAFRDYARGGVLAPSADLFCKVVGAWECVAQALEDIRIVPFAETSSALAAAPDLAYKTTDAHWTIATRDIFRR